ncbi:RNA polymerase sigma factor [Neisseria meningitidis]|nr:RNA polymerase sigma factor [Neisseria meningitidis]
MALPELTDAELAESRKLLLRFAHIQLPDRPDLAEVNWPPNLGHS